MRLAVLVIQGVLRLLAVLVLIIGFALWAHHGYQYIPMHAGAAIVIVVLLWTLSIMGIAVRVTPGLVLAGLLWGVLVLWFGFGMRGGRFATLFPGHLYEMARVLHFLIGLAAIGMAEVLGKRINRNIARGGAARSSSRF